VVEIDLQTTQYGHFGLSKQFAARKRTISKHRETSNFDLQMRIFNLQSFGPLYKKNCAETIFISLYNLSGEINVYQIVTKNHPTPDLSQKPKSAKTLKFCCPV
jgi:hypothetical protein